MSAELKPCPLCRATPHRGLGKVQYDQLHGEPFQNFSIWCPRLHVRVTAPSEQLARDEWNARAPDPALSAEVERLRERAEAAEAEAAALRAEVERLCEGALEGYYARQIEWSLQTFGPALRTKGVLDRIRKECAEVEVDPHDLSEWVDLIILAMDGFWRHGGGPEDLMPALLAKQRKNMARTWPDWRTMSADKAIEHDRSKDRAALSAREG